MPEHIHISGVAGVGMSALAQVLLDQGCRVTGSDRFHDQGQPLPVLEQLAAAGVELRPQDGSALQPGCAGLVFSTAIEDDNPEIRAARAHNIPLIHRADMLSRYANPKRCIAIAGTAGKTTTTGMVGWILEQAGLDPTVVNGGALVSWSQPNAVGNVRRGQSDWWVLEVDESDKSLLRFTPEHALITNISIDHFDLDETTTLFRNFAAQVRSDLVCGAQAAEHLHSPKASVVEQTPKRDATGWHTTFHTHTLRLPAMPGRHNAENALHAAHLCHRIGIDPATITTALTNFCGIERRLQIHRPSHPIVVDDYGHNPAKIQAAWTTLAESCPRILGAWKPHGFGPLRTMRDELCAMFAATLRPADQLWILPVFYAGGTPGSDFDAEAFVAHLNQANVPARYAPDYDHLAAAWQTAAQPDDTLLAMGARDPHLPLFCQRLAHAFA